MGEACSTAAGTLFLGDEPEIPVAGKWISARGVVHTLGVETVVWHSGDITRFSKRRRVDGSSEYWTEIDGKIYTARLNADGDLVWSDGDTWKRDMRSPETKTYSAINQVMNKVGESYSHISTSTAAMTTIFRPSATEAQVGDEKPTRLDLRPTVSSQGATPRTVPNLGRQGSLPRDIDEVQPRVGRIHTSSVESDGVRSNTPSAFEGRSPILLAERHPVRPTPRASEGERSGVTVPRPKQRASPGTSPMSDGHPAFDFGIPGPPSSRAGDTSPPSLPPATFGTPLDGSPSTPLGRQSNPGDR